MCIYIYISIFSLWRLDHHPNVESYSISLRIIISLLDRLWGWKPSNERRRNDLTMAMGCLWGHPIALKFNDDQCHNSIYCSFKRFSRSLWWRSRPSFANETGAFSSMIYLSKMVMVHSCRVTIFLTII